MPGNTTIAKPQQYKDQYGRLAVVPEPVDGLHFLSPGDAKLRALVVQQEGNNTILDRLPGNPTPSWGKSHLEDQTPLLIKAVYWVFKPVASLVAPTGTRDVEEIATPGQRAQSWEELAASTWVELVSRYLLGSICILFMVRFSDHNASSLSRR